MLLLACPPSLVASPLSWSLIILPLMFPPLLFYKCSSDHIPSLIFFLIPLPLSLLRLSIPCPLPCIPPLHSTSTSLRLFVIHSLSSPVFLTIFYPFYPFPFPTCMTFPLKCVHPFYRYVSFPLDFSP